MKKYIYPGLWKKFFFNILDFILVVVIIFIISNIIYEFFTSLDTFDIKIIILNISFLSFYLWKYLNTGKSIMSFFTKYKLIDLLSNNIPSKWQLLKRLFLKYLWIEIFLILIIMLIIDNPTDGFAALGVGALVILLSLTILFIQLIVSWIILRKPGKYQNWYDKKTNIILVKELE